MMTSRPNVAKMICKSYPIIKKKPAINYFFEAMRNEKNSVEQINRNQVDESKMNCRFPRKFKTKSLRAIWNAISPEEKWKYYEMAKLDETRYREQTSLWITKAAPVLDEESGDEDENRLKFILPEPSDIEKESVKLMHKNHVKYEQYIQAETAKSMVKDIIRMTENLSINIPKDKLISAVPEHCRSVLSVPCRPPGPFQIFISENIKFLQRLRDKNYPDQKLFIVAASEWKKLSTKKRKDYEDRYDVRLTEYNEAMTKFKADLNLSDGDNYSDFTKIRKKFSRHIRRQMRSSKIVPIQVRNPFNFFLKEKTPTLKRDPDILKVINMWMDLSDSEKDKYRTMTKLDIERYKVDKEKYIEVVKKMTELLEKNG